MKYHDDLLREMSQGQVEILKEFLSDAKNQLDLAVQEYVRRTTNHFAVIVPDQKEYLTFIERRYRNILSLYDNTLNTFYAGIGQALTRSYRYGKSITESLILESGMNITGASIDSKALPVLIRDAAHDFRIATIQSKEMFRTYFKLSKQGVLTESELSEAVAKGLLKSGTPTSVRKNVIELFYKTDFSKSRTTQILSPRDKETRQFFLEKIGKKKFEELERLNSKLLEKKYIQILDKNGDPIHFKVDSYAELVARSRITDSQVTAAIEEGQRAGIALYTVPGHNTTANVCKPHEDEIYTTDPLLAKNRVFKFLTEKEKPGYHPRCSHRIFPLVLSNRKLFALIATRSNEKIARKWFRKQGKTIPERSVAL
ncbi:hypothetical protein JWG44_21690 [Leptospira sp. 201903071]|uniref:hypothetical protein n=1 Tax=Leptospira ainazelensis TaxID=2810034 RepID=UPI001963710F|nr:hypothetical protein [Leptospira ainazelensis]MBM9502870.1 hypothetical protein [Leptospira ainazelensis]